MRESEIFKKELIKLTPLLGEKKVLEMEKTFLTGDRKVRNVLWDLIDAIKAATVEEIGNIDSVFCPPPMEIIKDGEITLGMIKYGSTNLYPMKMRKSFLLNHIGIFGSTGYGKTNLIKYLVYQLSKLGIPVIIFDFSKRNYRCLFSVKELEKKIRIYTVGRNISPLRFNPLTPPKNVEKSRWMKTFAEIFDHAYWMMGGGRHIILKAMDELDVSLSATETERVMKLKDILAWIYAKEETFISPREKNWAATAKRALESLCFREIGEVFNTDEEFDIESLFENGKITIFELDSLSSNDRTFFIEILMEHIREYLLENKEREKINGVIVLEEAHHILNREKTKKLGTESIMDVVFREIRELGIGIIYADQHPSLVSYTALGNTSTQIYFNLGLDTKNASDIEDAAAMLGLEEEEKDVIRKLSIGEAMMICRRLGYVSPFLVKFPKFSGDDEVVKDNAIQNIFLSSNPRNEGKSEKAIKEDASTSHTSRPTVSLSEMMLNEKEKEILKILYLKLASITSEIYKLAKLSGKRFKKLSEKLRNREIINFYEFKSKKCKIKVFFLTEKGEILCNKLFGSGEKKENLKRDLKMTELFEEKERKEKEILESDGAIIKKQGDTSVVFLADARGLKKIGKENLIKAMVICEDERTMNMFLMWLARSAREEKIIEFDLKINSLEGIKHGKKWLELKHE